MYFGIQQQYIHTYIYIYIYEKYNLIKNFKLYNYNIALYK